MLLNRVWIRSLTVADFRERPNETLTPLHLGSCRSVLKSATVWYRPAV